MALSKESLAQELRTLFSVLLQNSITTIQESNWLSEQQKQEAIAQVTEKIQYITSGVSTSIDNYTKGGYSEGNITNQYLKWDMTENKYIPLTAEDFKTELGIIESDAPELGTSRMFVSETEPEDAVENDIWIKI